MSRLANGRHRQWDRPWALMAALLLLLPSVTTARAATPSPAATRPPNIVFILTDDLDGVEWRRFPQIQKLLVAQGISFDQYFATDSLCCPSRSSIFLGEYVHNHQVEGNQLPDGGYQKFLQQGHETSNIATWLHDAGYRTGMIGEFLNDYATGKGADLTHVPPGWDEWDVPINNGGYPEFDYTLNQNGKLVKHGHAAQDYLVDVTSSKGDAFITQAASAGKPFFLELATYAPHQPATPAPRYGARSQAFRLRADPRSTRRMSATNRLGFRRDTSFPPPRSRASTRSTGNGYSRCWRWTIWSRMS